jgi:hypothetical protein
MAETPDRPHRTGFFWLDFLVAASAVIISLISLWVAQRSDSAQERLLAASTWPYVTFYTSNVLPDHRREIQLAFKNSGVGPAKVRWVTVSYRGKTYVHHGDLLKACCNTEGLSQLMGRTINSSVTHTVLVPHEAVSFLAVDRTAANAVAYQALNDSLRELHVDACYCSVLDDCWMVHNHTEEDPKPVSNCPPIPADAFQD